MKILFIIKKRVSYGNSNGKTASYGLINSAKFVVNFLNQNLKDVEANVVEVVDNNCIDREVTKYKPDVVIIEALWVVPEKFNVLIPLHPNVNWVVRLHSKTAFIANEGIAFPWIAKYIEIGKKTQKLHISPNNEEFAAYLAKIYSEKKLFTPNIYPDVYRDQIVKNSNKEEIHIGCFGAIRPMKNHLTQAIAAIAFAKYKNKKLYFHINDDRTEQHGENVLKNLVALFDSTENAELVRHPWMPHDEFLKLVSSMDLGTQVSLTETYNIVAADFVSSGVPILVSKEIDWAPLLYRANPNSIQSIVNGYERLYLLNSKFLTNWAKHNLNKSNQVALAHWIKFVNYFKPKD